MVGVSAVGAVGLGVEAGWGALVAAGEAVGLVVAVAAKAGMKVGVGVGIRVSTAAGLGMFSGDRVGGTDDPPQANNPITRKPASNLNTLT